MLTVNRPRLLKPPGNPLPRLKTNTPEVRHLAGAWIFNEPGGKRVYDLTRGPQQDMTIDPDVVASNAYRGTETRGRALTLTSSSGAGCIAVTAGRSPAYLADLNYWTLIWRQRLDITNNYRMIFETGRWRVLAGLGGMFNYNAAIEFWKNTAQRASVSNFFLEGEVCTYAVCYGVGTVYYLRNGELIGTTGRWGSASPWSASNPNIAIGSEVDGTRPAPGFISEFYVYDHHLPLSVIRGIMHNMQSVLAPETIYVDLPVSGGNILTAESGSYNYTGYDAGLISPAKGIEAESGSYGYTGYDADLLVNRYMVADSGAYNYTGYDADLTTAKGMTAESGAYGYTGYDVGLIAPKKLLAESGAYGYTGYDVTLSTTAEKRWLDLGGSPAGPWEDPTGGAAGPWNDL